MRVFVDIGGYLGHSTLAALDPIFGFDRVLCFEPVPRLAEKIREISDPRVIVIEAALSDREGRAILYHAGTLAGSLFADAPAYEEEGEQIEIRTVCASNILPSLIPNDAFVRTKFNCEGAEARIIEDLLVYTDEKFSRNIISQSLIDFDVEKIESQKNERQKIEQLLNDRNIRFLSPPECQYGMVTNYGGVRNYLIKSGSIMIDNASLRIRSIFYNAMKMRNSSLNGYHKMRILRAIPLLRLFARSGKS